MGTVIRGGFGVFYDLATSEMGNVVSPFNYPEGATTFLFGGNFPFTPDQLQPPPITPAGGVQAFDPHLRLPYTLQWNIAAEQALGQQQSLTASYVGSSGRRLLRQRFCLLPRLNYLLRSSPGTAANPNMTRCSCNSNGA